MRSIKIYLLLLITLGLLSVACSELQNDLVVPTKVGTHGTEALTKSSASFHGKILIKDVSGDDLKGCRQCHASDLSGGTAKVSCASADCHPSITMHAASLIDIKNPASSNFHGKYIANLNYNMRDCAKCHGANYAGGISSPTCNSCHKNSGGPEACNTCHGDFSNPSLLAPPKALNNATVTTDPGVGAHRVHLTSLTTMPNVECNECHIVPSSLYAAGHLDNTVKAELTFGSFTNSGISKASYNSASNTCTNTYCHGNFQFSKSNSSYQFAYTSDKMTGSNYSPKWTKVDGTEGKCGSCHGLPPAGHQPAELKACSTCHPGIVKEVIVNKVLTLEIADKSKHINGKINVFGN
jgi:predicted CxxxxCH...CXXCH cytochrome family protein